MNAAMPSSNDFKGPVSGVFIIGQLYKGPIVSAWSFLSSCHFPLLPLSVNLSEQASSYKSEGI